MDGCLSLDVVRKMFAEQQLSFLPTIMDVHPFLLHVICTSFKGLKLSTSQPLFNNLLVRRSLSVEPSPIQRIHRPKKREDVLHDRARRRSQKSKSAKQPERIGTDTYRKIRLEGDLKFAS